MWVPDRYLLRVLELLGPRGQDVMEIEVDRQGRWRPIGWKQKWFTLTEGPTVEDFDENMEVIVVDDE